MNSKQPKYIFNQHALPKTVDAGEAAGALLAFISGVQAVIPHESYDSLPNWMKVYWKAVREAGDE